MTAQEKLNAIDEALSKAGFKGRGTLEKATLLIQEHKKLKRNEGHKQYIIDGAIQFLQTGEIT